MDTSVLGLHHVTATVAGAQDDLDFYVGVLGLRLVKKTINFDNPGVYHFYYGDERGSPGSLMTTFPYAGKGVREGVKGAGQITVTSFSVPEGSLDGWRRRLREAGATHAAEADRFGQEVISVEDPSGLRLELVASRGDERSPWTGAGVDADLAIRGLHSVTLSVRDPEPTLDLLTRALGWRASGEDGARTRVFAGGDAAGHWLEVLHAPDAPDAVNGIGTVHHVAMAIADAEGQLVLRERLLDLGRQVTEVRDRQYFRSIYFREPGGILYEVATLPPGFAIDEEPAALGRELRLPPWEEPNRAAIEGGLPDVRVPL